jgi:general secretion pathway protein G
MVEFVEPRLVVSPPAVPCAALRSAAKPAIRRRRTLHARGATLLEVMIVVVILGLIAGGVAVAVVPRLAEAQEKTTRTSATELRRAAETWRGMKGGDQCPTAQLLQQEKAIDSASKISDAWDSPFKIICEDDETTVVSFGKDKKEGTADDIRVPDLAANKK